VTAAEFLGIPADDFGDTPTDAGIHFVENQRRYCGHLGLVTVWIARLMRESSPPEATSPAPAERRRRGRQ